MHQVRQYLGVVFLRPARDHLAGGRRPVVEDLRVHKPRLKRQQVPIFFYSYCLMKPQKKLVFLMAGQL